MSRVLAGFLLLLMFVFSASTWAQGVSREQMKGLDEQVQDIKGDVLGISTELSLLEEKLLFPSSTQVSLFVSLSPRDRFRLDSIEIELNGQAVAHHIYSHKELEALRGGGMQRIYTGNVRTGEHELRVGMAGRTASGNEFRHVENYRFSKGVGPGLVEISLSGPGVNTRTIEFKDR
jgi:hypothetical protein